MSILEDNYPEIQSPNNDDYLIQPTGGNMYKIVMLGAYAVGKSSLTIRFVND